MSQRSQHFTDTDKSFLQNCVERLTDGIFCGDSDVNPNPLKYCATDPVQKTWVQLGRVSKVGLVRVSKER